MFNHLMFIAFMEVSLIILDAGILRGLVTESLSLIELVPLGRIQRFYVILFELLKSLSLTNKVLV